MILLRPGAALLVLFLLVPVALALLILVLGFAWIAALIGATLAAGALAFAWLRRLFFGDRARQPPPPPPYLPPERS